MAWKSMNRAQTETVSPFAPVPSHYLAIALLALGFGAVAARAQDEVLPEPSVQAPLAVRSLLLDACLADGNFVVVGSRGHILISDDEGESWRQMEVPASATLTGVYFHDRNLGWAVGHDSVILRTSDGGATWNLVNWAPEEESPLLDVWFADAENGFAIGAYGSFYRTSDSGETWSFEPISEWDYHLHHIARSTDGRLYMAAEAGVIYRSDDVGETWIELPSPYEGSFFGTLPLEGESVLVFGLQGHLFRSEDAGESWTPIETGTTAMLTDAIRLGDGTIVITGLGGALLVSTDDSQTFELYPQPDRRGISAAVETGEGRLLLVGEFGTKLLSVSDLVK